VPGVRLIRIWLAEDRTQTWLAERCGVTAPTVYRWYQGENAPDPISRRVIHDLSRKTDIHIHFDDWYTDDEIRRAYRYSPRSLIARLRRREKLTCLVNIVK
jgi:hypothetical protein